MTLIVSLPSQALTISLRQNVFILGPTASAHESTILLKPQTHSQALAACSRLSEGLLQTNGTYFESDIKNLIQYREYLGTSLLENYWVASSSSETCQAVSVLGVHTVSCDEIFPAFCSNSAPNRISGQTDLSPQYQVQVNTGKLQVQGSVFLCYLCQFAPFNRNTVLGITSSSDSLVSHMPIPSLSVGPTPMCSVVTGL